MASLAKKCLKLVFLEERWPPYPDIVVWEVTMAPVPFFFLLLYLFHDAACYAPSVEMKWPLVFCGEGWCTAISPKSVTWLSNGAPMGRGNERTFAGESGRVGAGAKFDLGVILIVMRSLGHWLKVPRALTSVIIPSFGSIGSCRFIQLAFTMSTCTLACPATTSVSRTLVSGVGL